MAISNAFCTSFKTELLAMSPHTAGDVYKMALYTSAATLGAATTSYNAANEVSGVGYVAGGTILANLTVSFSGTTAWLTWDSPTWPASTITARGCLIYNSSQGNRALATYDFGQDVTSSASTFTATIPAAGAAMSLIRIA